MTKENVDLLLEITMNIIRSLSMGDDSVLRGYADDDFIFTNAGDCFSSCSDPEKKVVLVHNCNIGSECAISDDDFIAVQNCGNACTIIGRFFLPAPDLENAEPSMQTCIFTWELSDREKPVLKHLGVSCSGKCALSPEYAAPQRRMSSSTAEVRRMAVTDLNEHTRFLDRSSILYATSDGRNTMIHCTAQDINAHISISAFLKEAGGSFVSIHRCYAVNLAHITEIKPYSVTLSDGTELPIPVKRYSEIKQKLIDMLSGQ